MLVCESVVMTDEQPAKIKRRSLVMRDLNKKLKKITRQVGVFDTVDPIPPTTARDDTTSLQSDANGSNSDSLGIITPTDANGALIEEDFFDIISRLQGNRIEDQRTEMPAALLKPQNLKLKNSPTLPAKNVAKEKKEEKEPITEVLALGAPYPMVVLPVDGEYWMEGTYHVLSRDLSNDRPIFPTIDLSRCTLDQDTNVYEYRRNFVGKEHMNFVGTDTNHGHVLMSVRLDSQLNSDTSPKEQSQDNYKVLLRLKDKTIDKTIPTSNFLTDYPGPRHFMKQMLNEGIDVERFHPVAIPRASEEIMKFDEHCVSNCYKIGVIYQKHGQVSEEEYLQNQDESPALREFMDLIGDRVDLKNFPNYRGGLDVKHGQTGENSYYTNFKEREIMFHVCPLMPHTPNDPQQLDRKRHIGNDVVSIVFQEENTPFCPSSIRSHFLHCFIVVQVENPNTDNTHYKVSVAAKEGVPKFAPSLPNPCIFKKGEDFRNFLLTKVLNAENAAVKSEKFSALAERTRTMLLQGLVSEFMSKNEKILEDGTFQNSDPIEVHHSKSGSILSTFRSALNRSSRNENDTTSISSNSSTGTTNLNSSKMIGHSLSLNDLNAFDEEEGKKESESSSPGRKQGKKDKNEKHKKDKSKSSSNSNILPTLSSSTPLKCETQPEKLSPRQRSRYYTNQLFETTEALEAANSLQQQKANSLPRNGKFGTMNEDSTPKSPSSEKSAPPPPPPLEHKPKIIQVSTQTKYENEDQINNNTDSNTDEKLESAHVEIERLRAEINKLKIDKMDLVRQNVIHQREIKKLNERLIPSSHRSNELRSLSMRSSYDPRRVYNATATTFAEFV